MNDTNDRAEADANANADADADAEKDVDSVDANDTANDVESKVLGLDDLPEPPTGDSDDVKTAPLPEGD
jgi:hypothetical protein